MQRRVATAKDERVFPSASNTPVVGRFAPSPTGRMHAGNIFAALMSWLMTKSQGGKMVLRIEDLDMQRSKPQFVDAIERDFEMLGLTWDFGPFFQHGRTDAYQAVYQELSERNLVYPCFCTRADLHAASAPHRGEKTVYPGTCRNLTDDARALLAKQHSPSHRLMVPDKTVSFTDQIQGVYTQNLAHGCGDFIIRRSDKAFAYQLAVVVDDAEQKVNSVVRGVDLLCSTPQQMYLQNLLGLSHPVYAHVPLIVAQKDRRLSKRDHDAALDALLARFGTPQGVIGHIANLVGLAPTDEPVTPQELLGNFDREKLSTLFVDPIQIRWKC